LELWRELDLYLASAVNAETAPPQVARGLARRCAAPDPALLGALILGLIFCLYGIHWGVTEPWNPDQMAFHPARTDDGRLNLHPGNFLKPPFHKYFSFALARIPAYAMSELFGFSDITLHKMTLVWARMLTVALFLMQVVLVYAITQRFFGRFAACILTLVYATSAGLITFSHFLTADIPVTTWMLVAFYFAQNVLLRGRLADYLLAGAFTGIAAATKYNGLAIGITFVVAHALATGSHSIIRGAFDRRLILGLVAVPLSFIVVNPFSILDARTFINDFMYNMVTTPVYGGDTGGNNYLGYWWCVIEIVGLPAFILLVPAVIGSWFTIRRGFDTLESHGLVMLLSISLLYYAYFGSFARLETRFVLPVVPYFLMMAGPACARLQSSARIVVPVLGLLLLYNAACSALVGSRFVNDPRMAARSWLRDNLPVQAVVEYSYYAPRPDRIEGAAFAGVPMPMVSGRSRILREVLADNVWVRANIDRLEQGGADWYSPESLAARAPDAVVVDSLYYSRFLEDRRAGKAYSEIGEFFVQLLQERLGYRIVFDRTSSDAPWWAYPGEIDFLYNRIVILERSAGTG
jgi:hypothetical protein